MGCKVPKAPRPCRGGASHPTNTSAAAAASIPGFCGMVAAAPSRRRDVHHWPPRRADNTVASTPPGCSAAIRALTFPVLFLVAGTVKKKKKIPISVPVETGEEMVPSPHGLSTVLAPEPFQPWFLSLCFGAQTSSLSAWRSSQCWNSILSSSWRGIGL